MEIEQTERHDVGNGQWVLLAETDENESGLWDVRESEGKSGILGKKRFLAIVIWWEAMIVDRAFLMFTTYHNQSVKLVDLNTWTKVGAVFLKITESGGFRVQSLMK